MRMLKYSPWLGGSDKRSGSCLTIGNEAELLLATLHRMWPDLAAAKHMLQLQSHKVGVMKAVAAQNCFVHYYILVADL